VKRGMGGGSYRGPVGILRQRRTVRFVQLSLIAMAAALLIFAGYSLGQVNGYEQGRRIDSLSAPKPPPAAKTVVLTLLGMGALVAAVLLQGQEGVRLPVPARLEELTGRAEAAAGRAEVASEDTV
jgi:TRAP-type C4-dicarboxylate transport system permease small subunit